MPKIRADTSPGAITPLQQEALDRLRLMFSGKATSQDLAALEQWRRASPEHEQAFDLASRMFRFADSYKRSDADYYSPTLLQRPVTRRIAIGGVAAAAVGYGLISPPLALWPSLAELSSDYRTGIGEQRAVKLANGLSLELNTATSIKVRNQPRQPGIALISGEVAVEADLAPSMAFIAYANDTLVQAQHASFSLRKTDEGARAICIDGRIFVIQGTGRKILAAGQAVDCRAGQDQPGPLFRVDTTAETAWRRGQLQFYDAPLSEIVAEINRYRRGKIVIVNSEIKDRRLNGIFWLNHLDDMASHLSLMANVSATTLPGGIIVLS